MTVSHEGRCHLCGEQGPDCTCGDMTRTGVCLGRANAGCCDSACEEDGECLHPAVSLPVPRDTDTTEEK